MMRNKIAVIMLGFFLLFFSASGFAQEETWMKEVDMPAGDPVAGRAAFIRYNCNSCHRVQHDPELPYVHGDIVGPVFDMHAERPVSMLDEKRKALRESLGLPHFDYRAENLAMSIISPSHSIAPGYGKGSAEDEPESNMPNFDEKMTLKDLRDIVAYLTDSSNG